MSDELIFISGLILGGAIGMGLIGFMAIKKVQDMEEVIGKLKIDLRYAQQIRSGEHE